ncbi:MAG: PhzF family phenazine biosynthesis protein [Marinoscillum sp.]|uniref:PhzF family phenazine biosynthesis protein n=1 Tax=Marinoscillum sp. TaxID=2024838 RepID=UPI0032FD0161
MTVDVQIVNAFTEAKTGGNPAGVVLNADDLTSVQKLAIAAQIGLSETAFVSSSKIADFKLDFFTPNRQIAHCGHATIGAFSYLRQLGLIQGSYTSKETIDGRREIRLKGEQAYMEQLAPVYRHTNYLETAILRALGLQKSDLLPGAPLEVVNTGNNFLIIPVKDAKTMAAIIPNMTEITELSEALDLIGFYPFTLDTGTAKRIADTRMFGPRYQIYEEAGTGMAAGPLACYLYDVLGIKHEVFLIRQGKFMSKPSPSLIEVHLSTQNGAIEGLLAGGKGKISQQLTIEI